MKELTRKEKDYIELFLNELLVGTYISHIEFTSVLPIYLKRDIKKIFNEEELSKEIQLTPPFNNSTKFLNDSDFNKITDTNKIPNQDFLYTPGLSYKLIELSLKKVKISRVTLYKYYINIIFKDNSIFCINTNNCWDDGLSILDLREEYNGRYFHSDTSYFSLYAENGEYHFTDSLKIIRGYWNE